LFGISGLWSIKIGLGVFGSWGKFSVIGFGGSPLSNQFLPTRIGPISPLSGSWWIFCQYKAVVRTLA